MNFIKQCKYALSVRFDRSGVAVAGWALVQLSEFVEQLTGAVAFCARAQRNRAERGINVRWREVLAVHRLVRGVVHQAAT